jgi:hypothetical protein
MPSDTESVTHHSVQSDPDPDNAKHRASHRNSALKKPKKGRSAVHWSRCLSFRATCRHPSTHRTSSTWSGADTLSWSQLRDVTRILPSGNRSTVKVTSSEVASFSMTRFIGKGASCTLIWLRMRSAAGEGHRIGAPTASALITKLQNSRKGSSCQRLANASLMNRQRKMLTESSLKFRNAGRCSLITATAAPICRGNCRDSPVGMS